MEPIERLTRAPLPSGVWTARTFLTIVLEILCEAVAAMSVEFGLLIE